MGPAALPVKAAQQNSPCLAAGWHWQQAGRKGRSPTAPCTAELLRMLCRAALCPGLCIPLARPPHSSAPAPPAAPETPRRCGGRARPGSAGGRLVSRAHYWPGYASQPMPAACAETPGPSSCPTTHKHPPARQLTARPAAAGCSQSPSQSLQQLQSEAHTIPTSHAPARSPARAPAPGPLRPPT